VTLLQQAAMMARWPTQERYCPWIVRSVESVTGAVIRQYGPEKIQAPNLPET
jgi:hypothetical protein